MKWADDIIGLIDLSSAVTFTQPTYNTVVEMYTKGKRTWTSEQFTEFLAERVVSRDRRDIEKILFRLGLSQFDVLKVANATRGIHPKDLLWIAKSKDEKLNDAMTETFSSVFGKKIDAAGDSTNSPEGFNIKRYGVYNERYGIYKKRINPLTTDAESEVAVYLLAKELGVPCCPAYMVDEDTMFSEFLFDFSKEYIVHIRRLFDDRAFGEDEYKNLIETRPQYKDDFARMIILDFITRQDDRHRSNMAIKISTAGECFYPLYDNGRSLFYEDTEERVSKAIADPIVHCTSFGQRGTYYDAINDIIKDRGNLKGLVNLNITEACVKDILVQAKFKGYRLDGALKWIMSTLKILNTAQGE